MNDPAQVLNIMKSTNFCEILSLLYSIFIHDTGNNSTIIVHEKTCLIVINSMVILNTLATLDLDTFQVRIKLVNLHFQ
jgi:flagellar basal body P-ring protein FlgI